MLLCAARVTQGGWREGETEKVQKPEFCTDRVAAMVKSRRTIQKPGERRGLILSVLMFLKRFSGVVAICGVCHISASNRYMTQTLLPV